MRFLLLAGLLALALPSSASAAPGTITVSYVPVPGQPGNEVFTLTGTADDEIVDVGTETMTGGLGGEEGLRLGPRFGPLSTIAYAPGFSGRCEAAQSAGYLKCQKRGAGFNVTAISVDFGAGNDQAEFNVAGNILGSAPATPISVTGLGGPGNDYVGAGAGNDTLDGGTGNDELSGRGGTNTLTGGDDVDTIRSGGTDTVHAGLGNDTVYGGGGTATFYGDAGNDTLYGFDGDNTLYGGDGNDALYGDGNGGPSPGNDTLDGGADDDLLVGGPGVDSFTGGTGTDSVSYADATSTVSVTLDGAANDGRIDTNPGTPGNQGEGENVAADVENITGSNQADTLTGGPGNDTLDGANGDDTIAGAGGNDTLRGGSGNETFLAEPGADTYDGGGDAGDVLTYAARNAAVTVTMGAGAGNDGQTDTDPGTAGSQSEGDTVPLNMGKVIGSSVADALTGGANNDQLAGGPGGDTIQGGPGEDLIDGATGADTLDGGAGGNSVDYSSRSATVIVNLGNPATDGEAGEGDVLTNFLGIRGGGGNDTLTLAPAAADQTSLSLIRTVDGNGGNDTILGTDGGDNLNGGGGNDTITSLAGADRLTGGDGDDTLNGGTADDVLFGDAGYTGTGALQQPSYSEGGATPPGDGNDTLIGGSDQDTLVGGAGTDSLQGGSGSDALWGGIGPDSVDGGADGGDSVDLSSRAAGVTVTLDAGNGNDGNDVDGPAGARDTFTGVENVTGSNSADSITGSNSANSFVGRGGDDVLLTLGGDDTLDGGNGGGEGADVMDGGTGHDTATYGLNFGAAVNVSLDGVANDGRPADGAEGTGTAKDNVLQVEHLIGSPGSDTLTGSGADEVFESWGGTDTISAGGGNDVIWSGDSADTIDAGDGSDLIGTGYYDPRSPTYAYTDGAKDTATGGAGDDTLVSNDSGAGANGNVLRGGPGNDTLTYLGEIEPIRVSQDGVANDGVINRGAADNVSEFETLTGGSGADTITGGGGAATLEGAAGPDTINGGDAAEFLAGGDGDDTMNGGGGDDLLDGGTGKDTMTGGGGNDVVTYALRSKAVTVTLDGTATGNDGTPPVPAVPASPGVPFSPAVPGEQDKVETEGVIGGDGDDALTGSAGADVLRGGPGNDTVDGAAGDDTVDGGPGVDTLRSGAGVDVMDAADGQADTLTCDTRAGKTVSVDKTLDAFDSCADPASVPADGGSGGPLLVVPPFDVFTEPALPPAGPPLPAATEGVPSRAAKELAKAIKLKSRASAKKVSTPLAIGTATCASGRACTVSAVLLAGKKVVATGTVTGTDKVKGTVRLTSKGWSTVRSKKKASFTLRVTLTEGGSQATVKRSFTVSAAGGR